MIQIGVFVSTAGGILNSIDRAKQLGIDQMMFFATSPRSWERRGISDDEAVRFREAFRAAGFHSLWIHGSYLMNFGSDQPDVLEKSTGVLIADMHDAARLGAKGVIFHIGSHGGRGFGAVKDQLVKTFREVLEGTPKTSWLIFENAAGRGIGGRFGELGVLVKELQSERVKVCLDTQHAFAAGYAVNKKEDLERLLSDFEKTIGLDRLVVIHANDSKKPLGSGVDRHENIGEGLIGEAGWKFLTHHPKLQRVPFILEVPGADGKGPDKANVDRLRRIVKAR